jgi:2-amino-4-hydroxy-6-hydroxymethyldihydropteridine diphosphokinase
MSQSSRSGRPDGPAAKAVLSLGSNLGDREDHILEAASRIASSAAVSSARLSSLYETEPVGEGYSRTFINAVMILETSMAPRKLLELCQNLENTMGRNRGETSDGASSGDRSLDIDIILYGDEEIDEPDLKIPHPRYLERRFVLEPLMELEPDKNLPEGSGAVSRISSRRRMRLNT